MVFVEFLLNKIETLYLLLFNAVLYVLPNDQAMLLPEVFVKSLAPIAESLDIPVPAHYPLSYQHYL